MHSLAFLLAAATLLFPSPGLAMGPETLPPLGAEISDFEARLQLARLLSNAPGRIDEAIAQYRILFASHPDDPTVRQELADTLVRGRLFDEAVALLETVVQARPDPGGKTALALARAYAGLERHEDALAVLEPLQETFAEDRAIGLELYGAYHLSGKPEKASAILDKLLAAFPGDPQLLVLAADREAAAGHAESCRKYYAQAMDSAEDPTAIRLAYASRMNMWGDFYGVESIYRDHLAVHPEDMEIRRKLAEVWVSSQRYEEAEGLYRLLRIDGYPETAILFDTAKLHAAAKNDVQALETIGRLLDPDPAPRAMALHYTGQAGTLYLRLSFPQPIERVTTFSLTDPERLVFDLHGVSRPTADRTFSVDHAAVRRIRVGIHPDRTRLVMDVGTRKPPAPTAVYGDHTLHLWFHTGRSTRDEAEGIAVAAFGLKADLLARAGRTRPALFAHRFRTLIPESRTDARLSVGRLLLKQGKATEAASWFEKAYGDKPADIAARFYHTGLDTVASEGFLARLTAPGETPPMVLVRWGELYAENGLYEPAGACYRAALAADPACFPARLALAETLAYDRQFDPSIAAFKALAGAFPGNRKILVSWARALSWARAYDEAIAVYQRIHRDNPEDPLPLMEMARTAEWGKQMERAMNSYAVLGKIPVDRRLVHELHALFPGDVPPPLTGIVEDARRSAENGALYDGYERFAAGLAGVDGGLDPDTRRRLHRVAADLWGTYRIQKIARLESRAKQLAWNRRFPAALSVYDALIDTRPGNQEAIFSRGQLQCALGLCDGEAETYTGLLRIEPYHTLAAEALDRQRWRSRPAGALRYSYWNERGRDELSKISRHHYEIAADLPLTCGHRLAITGHRWHEDGRLGKGGYPAIGHSIGYNGVLGPQATAALSWTRKHYSEGRLGETDTGAAALTYRMANGAEATAGYERSDELYNEFGIRQKIQSDSWWAAVHAPITRRWDAGLTGRRLRYTDDNDAARFGMTVGYQVTDHPRLFKISLAGAYQDTREENRYHYTDGLLVDITHPYWTPTDNVSTTVILEWNHDLAEKFFCGAERHDYHLRLSAGTDSESNASVRLEGGWRYEFRDRWSINLNGLVHRSEEWDAEGIWSEIRYAF